MTAVLAPLGGMLHHQEPTTRRAATLALTEVGRREGAPQESALRLLLGAADVDVEPRSAAAAEAPPQVGAWDPPGRRRGPRVPGVPRPEGGGGGLDGPGPGARESRGRAARHPAADPGRGSRGLCAPAVQGPRGAPVADRRGSDRHGEGGRCRRPLGGPGPLLRVRERTGRPRKRLAGLATTGPSARRITTLRVLAAMGVDAAPACERLRRRGPTQTPPSARRRARPFARCASSRVPWSRPQGDELARWLGHTDADGRAMLLQILDSVPAERLLPHGRLLLENVRPALLEAKARPGARS